MGYVYFAIALAALTAAMTAYIYGLANCIAQGLC